MKEGEYTLYALVDSKNYEDTIFVGTLVELCEYTGRTKNAILSAISQSKRRGNRCRYVRIGKESELD